MKEVPGMTRRTLIMVLLLIAVCFLFIPCAEANTVLFEKYKISSGGSDKGVQYIEIKKFDNDDFMSKGIKVIVSNEQFDKVNKYDRFVLDYTVDQDSEGNYILVDFKVVGDYIEGKIVSVNLDEWEKNGYTFVAGEGKLLSFEDIGGEGRSVLMKVEVNGNVQGFGTYTDVQREFENKVGSYVRMYRFSQDPTDDVITKMEIISSLSSTQAGTNTPPASQVAVKINGVVQKYDQSPVIIDDRTLVPMRGIFEALGANVAWDEATQSVTATKGDITIKLTIGAKIVSVNGSDTVLDQTPQLINGRTMVPVRFISEALGAKVDWDDATQTVLISKID